MISLDSQDAFAAGIDNADADPMSNVANLVDCMLVFMLGLIIALVAYWNVALPDKELIQLNKKDLEEVQDIQQVMSQITSTESVYEELGTVYRDPFTNKLYMLAEDEETSADAELAGAAKAGGAGSSESGGDASGSSSTS